MSKLIFTALLGILITIGNGFAQSFTDTYSGGETYTTDSETYTDVQTVYTEVPVQSYHAYPDDQNFVPEDEFMQRADSLNYDQNITDARTQESNAHNGVIFAEKPMVICRDFACTRLNERITRTFLFNSIINMFITNTYSNLNICEADPFSRSCLQSGISFPVRSGVANALIKIPKATISQVNISTGISKATVGITYDFLVNGIDRVCEPTIMDIIVPVNSQATLLNREFACNMTSDGMTNVSIMLNIDYIDLDYGIIGGYYSLGLQGPTTGGGTGYALFKTQYSNNGIKMNAATNGNGTKSNSKELNTIRPGEYAVEPLEK